MKKGFTHTFSYTASNNNLTATCTADCDKGYDTMPFTLTLTTPSSLAYDGNSVDADKTANSDFEITTVLVGEPRKKLGFKGYDVFIHEIYTL